MLEKLNQTYGIHSILRFEEHPSGLIRGIVSSEACQGSFFLLGAHVAEFQPRGAEPVLFMSAESNYEVGKPIRGGVPICFPWFGAHPSDPSAPAHGTARIALWEVIETAVMNGIVSVYLQLRIGSLELKYVIQFERSLGLQFQVTSTDTHEQRCELALHSYFSVSDIARVSILGLESHAFRDQLTGETKVASDRAIQFEAETDRVYQGAVDQLTIQDPGLGRKLIITPVGSNSTVVWNPWIAKSKRMSDFGDQEYHSMCCVETANVAAGAMHLAPGATAETSVRIAIET